MHFVNSYLQLVETTEMWEDLFISQSGSRIFLQQPPPASSQLHNSFWLHHCHFSSYLSLYNCFFYFLVGIFHQWPLINLQQINFIHCCSILPQQWIPMPATRGGSWLPPYNFCSNCFIRVLPSSLSSCFFQSFSPQGVALFSSHDLYIIRLPLGNQLALGWLHP